MTAQQLYDSLDRKQRRDLLLKVGETREEAQVLSQRDEFREKNVRRRTGQLKSTPSRLCPGSNRSPVRASGLSGRACALALSDLPLPSSLSSQSFPIFRLYLVQL
jgi:hypothetical protein